MKRAGVKIIYSLIILLACVFITLAFTFTNPDASKEVVHPKKSELITFSSHNSESTNSFKSSVDFVFSSQHENESFFLGKSIRIIDNDNLDEVRVHLTDYNSTLLEFWNKGQLLHTHKSGFKEELKIKNEYTLSFTVDQERSLIHIRIRDSLLGALNEIGEMNFDYSDYANEIVPESVRLFATTESVSFANFLVWEEWEIID
jgi:hypothetical protein